MKKATISSRNFGPALPELTSQEIAVVSPMRKGAERMGGRAGVESELGRGSRFWVELPAAERSQGGS